MNVANCSIERGCGRRESGGVYGEVGVGEGGMPLEHFILDPPTILTPDLGVTAIGVKLIPSRDKDGEIVWHVADWIGSNNYPNVWDFLGEARLFGISRRFPKTLDFSKLSSRSRLLCIHSRAAVMNAERYAGNGYKRFGYPPALLRGQFAARPVTPVHGGWHCPKDCVSHEPHFPVNPCCAGIWAQDVENGEPLTEAQKLSYGHPAECLKGVDNAFYEIDDARLVLRKMPSFSYFARRAPDHVEPIYKPAFFASFPLHRLVVVQGHGDADALEKANAANLPVNLVKE